MMHCELAGIRHLAAVHAGWGNPSVSRELMEWLLGAVCEVSPNPIEAHVIGVRDLLSSIHGALTAEVLDVKLLETRKTITDADGVIAVTPIVHGAYSGPFKSFVDLMGTQAWEAKPVLIAACGGTQRHCLALEHVVRPLFVCLRSIVLPTAVFATAGECEPGRVAADTSARIERSARELAAAIAIRAGVAEPGRVAVS